MLPAVESMDEDVFVFSLYRGDVFYRDVEILVALTDQYPAFGLASGFACSRRLHFADIFT